MSLRNPELQRLLDNLRNASQNGTPHSTENTTSTNAAVIGTTPIALNRNNAPFPASSSQDISRPRDEARDHGQQTPGKIQPSSATLQPTDIRSRSTTPSVPATPDASAITTWPAAVKHVTKYVVNNDQAAARIKHLIAEQHKHEEQWWTQREAIVSKHNGRADSNTKVADLLKELGGLAIPIAQVDQAADKNELDTFDKKVYKSLVRMAADFDGQLRKLGVPFYAIKHDLVILDEKRENGLSIKGRLDRGELRELQKRMLQYLEDLLMDEES